MGYPSFLRRSSPFWPVLALAAEVVIYFSYHPLESNPLGGALVILCCSVVAVGLLFRLRWVRQFSFLACLAVIGGDFVIRALGNGAEFWQIFLYLAFASTALSVFAPYHWRYPLVDPEEFDEDFDEHRPHAGVFSRIVGGLLPRSRLALCQAVACSCFGLSEFVALDMELLGFALMVPELILGAAFWFHQGWVRWYGPLLCLAWAGFTLWLANRNGFNPMDLLNYMALMFVMAAFGLRRVHFLGT